MPKGQKKRENPLSSVILIWTTLRARPNGNHFWFIYLFIPHLQYIHQKAESVVRRALCYHINNEQSTIKGGVFALFNRHLLATHKAQTHQNFINTLSS